MRKTLQLGAGGLLCFAVVGLSCSSSTTVESSGGTSGVDGGRSGGAAGTSRGGSGNAGTAGKGGTSAGGAGGVSTGGSAGTSTGGSAGTSAGGSAGTSAGGSAGTSAGGSAGNMLDASTDAATDGSGGAPQNCAGLPSACGVNANRNCCETAAVPGGPFPMGRGSASDAFASGLADEQPEHTATPLPYRLDVFEVTVGRFRRFLAGYPANRPAAGAGSHPGIVNSGWQAAWNAELSDDAYFFGIELKCSNRTTWTDNPGANENKPINCLTYYAAFAFCAWDSGFLPTEAEWEFAAAGGAENRLYAWGNQAPDRTRTAVDCAYGANYPVCEFDDIPLAGVLTAGAGRYGHLDMSGSMWEWTLDAYSATYYSGAGQTCNNCANLSGTTRVRRGGSWSSYPEEIRAVRRDEEDPAERDENSGVRCARL